MNVATFVIAIEQNIFPRVETFGGLWKIDIFHFFLSKFWPPLRCTHRKLVFGLCKLTMAVFIPKVKQTTIKSQY